METLNDPQKRRFLFVHRDQYDDTERETLIHADNVDDASRIFRSKYPDNAIIGIEFLSH